MVTAQILQSMETFLTLKVIQYCKGGHTFSSSEPIAVSSYYI